MAPAVQSNFITRRLPNSLPWLLIAISALLFFYAPLFEKRILLYRDLFFFHYPLRFYWISLLHQGIPPFFNGALNGGQPLLSNPNYAVFYPGNLLYFALPFNFAWNLALILHVLWIAIGMYLLSRTLRFSRSSSLAGSMVLAWSGPVLSALNYYNLLVAASWIPWIVLFFGKALENKGKWILLCSFALAAQILAGEPTVALLTLTILTVIAIHSLRHSATKRRNALIFLSIVLLAGGLSGVQLLPTLLWLPNSGRSESLDFFHSAAYWSMHPARLIELFTPNFFGTVMARESKDFWGTFSDSGYPYIFCLYCGWLPLLLLPFAWKTPIGRTGLMITLLALLFALGRHLPGYHLLFTILPPMHLIRYPEKFLLLVPFGLALSTSAAMMILTRPSVSKSIIGSAMFLAGIMLALFFLRGLGVQNDQQKFLQINAFKQSMIWCALTFLMLTFAVLRKSTFTAALLPVLLLLDLFHVTRDLPQTMSLKDVDTKPFLLSHFPETGDQPLLHDAETRADEYFKGGISPEFYLKEALHPLTGLKWGIQYGATNDIDRMSWLVSEARRQWIQERFPRADAIEEMRRAGIARVISLRIIKSPELPVERVLQLNEHKFILIYHVTPSPHSMIRWEAGSGELAWQEVSPDHFRIRINSSQAGTIFVARNAVPGWQVQIDRSSARITPSPQGWIRIFTLPGKHNIELAYRPPGLFAGSMISALASLILLGLFLIG